jgi:hypothetical protein
VEARAFWWQAFDRKMDGVLYWGLNIWDRAHNERPIDPARGQFLDWSITTGGDYGWLHGDGELLYPGVAGPIGSIRLANIRDGIEDLGYLALLEEQHPAMARHACAPVTTGLTRFTRDPATVRAQRDAVARRLAP